MKVITLSEIPGILDEALQYVGDGKGFKNVMFLGNEASGRNSVIKEWLAAHPEISYEEDDGYGDNEYRARSLSQGKSLLYQRRANHVDDRYAEKNMEILKDRKFTTASGKVIDLSEMPLVIATALNPEYFNNLTTLNDELLRLYDVYKVEPSLSEVIKHLREKAETKISYLQKEINDSSKSADSKELLVERLKKYQESLKTFDLLKDVKASFSGRISPIHFERNTQSTMPGYGDVRKWLDFLCNEDEADMHLINEMRKALGMEEESQK